MNFEGQGIHAGHTFGNIGIVGAEGGRDKMS